MAGRPKGQPKTGGRQKGTPNKTTQELEAFRAAAQDEGETTLEFFKRVYRNPQLEWSLRMAAAREAAKYCHPTFQAIAVQHRHEGEVSLPKQEIVRALAHTLLIGANTASETQH
jgi:hypothetical protein